MKHRIYVLITGGGVTLYTPDNNPQDYEIIVDDTDLESVGEKSVSREEMGNLTEDEWEFASEQADKEDEDEEEDEDEDEFPYGTDRSSS